MTFLTDFQTLNYPYFSKLLIVGFNFILLPRVAAVFQAKVVQMVLISGP